MTDLLDFLRARLDDDGETLATLDSTALNGIESTAGWSIREYVERGRHEVEAKRRILDLHVPEQHGFKYIDRGTRVPNMCCSVCHDVPEDVDYDNPPYAVDFPCPTLRLLALPYSDHPDYRDEWRPA